MAQCPFAKQVVISGPTGPYAGGPFRIVHHTTEGSTAAGAFAAFRAHRSDPHFTVDDTEIYQHIDTTQWSRSLVHTAGQPETNREHAVQIEAVGFAGYAKGRAVLENVARLCRWIEQTHGVPLVWPNGYPKPAVNHNDPGGHNRNMANWLADGGHYGHCHVPENVHWDPAYEKVEVDYLMALEVDPAFNLVVTPAAAALAAQLPTKGPAAISGHAIIPAEGVDHPG
ncbi:MAG TPA: N-acetylmuramoyl-L-alanine amidase [Caulobacteraceae bacterium]